MPKQNFPRQCKVFEFTDTDKFDRMRGQIEIVLRILREKNGPWTSRYLAEAIANDADFRGITPPVRVANWFMHKLNKAGCLTFYRSIREYETIIAIRSEKRNSTEDVHPS